MKKLLKKSDWINYNAGDSKTIQLIDDAIQHQYKVQIEYNGYWKEISPFNWSTSKDGNTLIVCYTIPGEGKDMDGADNGLNTRSYRVDKITNVRPMPNTNTDKGKYNENYDAMTEYDDLQSEYDKNYGTDKYIAVSRLKKVITAEISREVRYVTTSPILIREFNSDEEVDNYDCKDLPPEFEGDLEDAVINSMNALGEKGMAKYCDISDSIESIYVKISNGIAETYIDCSDELTKDEQDEVVSFINGQFSDGWGEGFEQRSFAKYVSDSEDGYSSQEIHLYASFWDANGWSIKIEKVF